jgi:hypothetical protein
MLFCLLLNFSVFAVVLGCSCKSPIIENADVLQAFQQLVNAIFKTQTISILLIPTRAQKGRAFSPCLM